jgi:hypothetical protein
VRLSPLGTKVFVKLLRMSQEEFVLTGVHDGRITLPCDAAVRDYAMCLLRRDASVEVVKAFMSSVASPHSFDVCRVAPYVELNQQVAFC